MHIIQGVLGVRAMIICNIAFDIISKNYLSGNTVDIKGTQIWKVIYLALQSCRMDEGWVKSLCAMSPRVSRGLGLEKVRSSTRSGVRVRASHQTFKIMISALICVARQMYFTCMVWVVCLMCRLGRSRHQFPTAMEGSSSLGCFMHHFLTHAFDCYGKSLNEGTAKSTCLPWMLWHVFRKFMWIQDIQKSLQGIWEPCNCDFQTHMASLKHDVNVSNYAIILEPSNLC